MLIEPMTLAHAAAMAASVRAPTLRDEGTVRELIAAGPAFACLHGGLPFALAGVANQGGGRGMAWAYIADGAPRHVVAVSLTRAARRWLDAAPFRRIEAVTVDGPAEWHKDCVRWAQRLGFMFEGMSHSWLADGGDVLRWYRLRGA
jgi:hypothetical protein